MVDVPGGRPAPTLYEQVLLQQNGFVFTMLWLEANDEQEDDDVEAEMTSKLRLQREWLMSALKGVLAVRCSSCMPKSKWSNTCRGYRNQLAASQNGVIIAPRIGNPAFSLTLALGETFPFNLTLGAPLHMMLAAAVTGG